MISTNHRSISVLPGNKGYRPWKCHWHSLWSYP